MTHDPTGETTRRRIVLALEGFKAAGHKPSQYEIARCIGRSQKTVSHQIGRLRDCFPPPSPR